MRRRRRKQVIPDGNLYRCFNADAELLYIGSTWRPAAERLKEHRKVQPWWCEVADVTVEQHPVDTLRLAEIEAIKAERPRYNVTHHPDLAPIPQVPVSPFWCMAEMWLSNGAVLCCDGHRGHDGDHVRDSSSWCDDDPGAEPDDLTLEFASVPYRARR